MGRGALGGGESSGVDVRPYYNLSVAQSLCGRTQGTWEMAHAGAVDAGAVSGATAFVGAWARSGTQTVTCPMGNPTMNAITGLSGSRWAL